MEPRGDGAAYLPGFGTGGNLCNTEAKQAASRSLSLQSLEAHGSTSPHAMALASQPTLKDTQDNQLARGLSQDSCPTFPLTPNGTRVDLGSPELLRASSMNMVAPLELALSPAMQKPAGTPPHDKPAEAMPHDRPADCSLPSVRDNGLGSDEVPNASRLLNSRLPPGQPAPPSPASVPSSPSKPCNLGRRGRPSKKIPKKATMYTDGTYWKNLEEHPKLSMMQECMLLCMYI